MTAVYAIAHMVVDLSCAFLVYAYVAGGEQWYLWLLIYNFCAFALQMPIGAAADRLNRNGCVAVGGCAGVLAGLFLGITGFPAAAAAAAGIGNACFHVGGGIDVLNRSESKAAPLGFFVAPGALGLYFGKILGNTGKGPVLWIAFLLLLSAAAIRVTAGREGLWITSGNSPAEFTVQKPRKLMAAALCFLAAVILRSFSGMIQEFPWKDALAGSGLILTAAVVFGKMAGGAAADKIGIRRTAFCTMAAAAAGFLFLAFPAAGILAVFTWNMSMPLTLWAVSKIFPESKGFSFGLLTFGLFLGFCPSYLWGSETWSGIPLWAERAASPEGLAIMAVLSLFLLSWGLKQVKV